MLQRMSVGIAIATALAILAFLLVKTQAQPLDLSRYRDRLKEVDRVVELEADLDQQIKQANQAMEAEPAGLALAQERLLAARQELKQAWLPSERLAPEIDRAIREYFRQADAKNAAVKNYREDLRNFVLAFDRLREQVDPVLAKLTAPAEAPVRAQLTTLIGKLATYITEPNPQNGAEISRIQATIGTDARAIGVKAIADIDRMIKGADAVRGAKDRLEGSHTTLKAVPTGPALEKSRDAFYRHYTAAETALARYRLALVLYASVLLVMIGFVGWRLRQAYAALNDANANLEEQVKARTSELRKALDELKANQVHMIQSEKMASLGQLVAGVAHEINTPLGYARSNVEIVKETVGTLCGLLRLYDDTVTSLPAKHIGEAQRQQLEEAKQGWHATETAAEIDGLLDDAQHGLVQITDLVMGLKDFSRVDRSQTEPFDLNAGLETALKIVHNKLKHRVEVHRDFAKLPMVRCAPSQLNQVFLNLLTNASQAIDGNGEIRIRTRDLGGKVEVVLADTGCGMDEKTQAHIFEPFFTTKAVGSGTGLGLSIVYRIIEDHGGSIKVVSAPGKGAEFTIVLPTRPVAKQESAEVQEATVAGVAT